MPRRSCTPSSPRRACSSLAARPCRTSRPTASIRSSTRRVDVARVCVLGAMLVTSPVWFVWGWCCPLGLCHELTAQSLERTAVNTEANRAKTAEQGKKAYTRRDGTKVKATPGRDTSIEQLWQKMMPGKQYPKSFFTSKGISAQSIKNASLGKGGPNSNKYLVQTAAQTRGTKPKNPNQKFTNNDARRKESMAMRVEESMFIKNPMKFWKGKK